MQVGDKVIFNCLESDSSKNEVGLLTRIGVIITDNKDETFNVLYWKTISYQIAKAVDIRSIKPITELDNEIDLIKNTYATLIKLEKDKLKTVSQEEKDKEKIELYENIKKRIIRNCEGLLQNDLDEVDFVNRVKEITNLKKQLFTPEKLPCMNEIHRYNGTIKYNIRELEREKSKIIEQLTGDNVKRYIGSL